MPNVHVLPTLTPEKYNIQEAFDYLRKHGAPLKNANSLYQLVHRKQIGHHHMVRELRFTQEDLDVYLASITGPHIPPMKLIEGGGHE